MNHDQPGWVLDSVPSAEPPDRPARLIHERLGKGQGDPAPVDPDLGD
jgi:hypothetical protein